MNNGDILLIKVNTFTAWYRWLLAKLIQLIDRSYYHHAGVFIDGKIHEAEAEGVVESELSKYNDAKVCILRPMVPLLAEEDRRLTKEYKRLLGKKYDYRGTLLFQLIFRFTRQWFWFGTTHGSATRKLYCSEHTVLGYHKVRGYFPKPWLVSPGDLRRSTGYFFVAFEGPLKALLEKQERSRRELSVPPPQRIDC